MSLALDQGHCEGLPSFDTSLTKGFGTSTVVLTRSDASPTRL
jgi:hypothetical protein